MCAVVTNDSNMYQATKCSYSYASCTTVQYCLLV